MFNLTETPETTSSEPADQVYTHPDGTHWVHSSLYTDDPSIDCWFTPDALVMWYPDVFEHDPMVPVSSMLKFPTFKPRASEATLAELVGEAWVVSSSRFSLNGLERDYTGYVYVNDWHSPSVCVDHFKNTLAYTLRLHLSLSRGVN